MKSLKNTCIFVTDAMARHELERRSFERMNKPDINWYFSIRFKTNSFAELGKLWGYRNVGKIIGGWYEKMLISSKYMPYVVWIGDSAI